MPIYEYVCEACGNRSEVIQKFSDAPLAECESCKGRLKKLMSRTSFQLKGAGWYATDYKKASGKEANQESKAEPSVSGDAKVGVDSETKAKQVDTKVPEKPAPLPKTEKE